MRFFESSFIASNITHENLMCFSENLVTVEQSIVFLKGLVMKRV